MKVVLLALLLSGCTVVFWSDNTTIDQPVEVDVGVVIDENDDE